MSRLGNCWNNSVMERFFRSLKSERLNGLSLINHSSAITEIESYIWFYNYKRRHSGLEYVTSYEMYMQMKKVA